MKTKSFFAIGLAAIVAFATCSSPAQENLSTPPGTTADLEALYTISIEGRAAEILSLLNLADPAQSNRVHNAIIAQYRVLRARDVFIDAMLKAEGKEINYSNRAAQIQYESKTLHDHFLAKLSSDLTPEQVEVVKDKMTYFKVKVTYDAYCAIFPNLNDDEKSIILQTLKTAREEAIDGGSAREKSEIFQKFKDQINAYLDARGHDVTKTIKEWEAKQELAKKSSEANSSTTAQ